VYNTQVYDGTGTDAVHNAHYLSVSIPEIDPSPVGAFTATVNHTGGYARIHEREVSKGGLYACQLDSDTDQIGCLVQADPLSVGIAANQGDTWEQRDPLVASDHSTSTAPNTQGLRVSQLQAGVACLPAPPGSGKPSYPLWRKLYFNTITGFARVTNASELNLGQYESVDSSINPILTQYNFFQLPFGPNGKGPGGNPAPFCEDLNEQAVCSATTTAANACNTNVGLTSSFGTIPSDPSSAPGSATTSTICGNGIIEDFEDCDTAAALPTGCGTCSTTCRCSNF
jgi:hypothetical protein